MKKIFLAFMFLLISILTIFFSSCATNQGDKYKIYLDDLNVRVDGISMKISCSESYVSWSSENKDLKVKVIFTNTEQDDRVLEISNPELLYEDTQIKYDLTVDNTEKIVLRRDIDVVCTFSARIPKSYKDNHYRLSFFNGKEYTIYLYERPDELRKDCYIQFVVQGTLVDTVTVKKGRKLSEMYIWENSNHMYHCGEWYVDETYQTKFSQNTTIEENLVLYGLSTANVSYTYSFDKDPFGVYVNKIKYVPKDGILVFNTEDFYFGDGLYISNYAIYDNNELEEIYFPKELKRIYFGNFSKMENLQKIHFEGTREEWNLIESSSTISENVTLIFNSVFS